MMPRTKVRRHCVDRRMGEIRDRGTRAVLAVIGCALGAVACYVIAVRTPLGQRWDESVFEARKALELAPRRAATAMLRPMVAPLVLLISILGIVAVRGDRRRRSTVVAAATGVVGVAVTARLLRMSLSRPSPVGHVWSSGANSWPSGHAAVIMALGLVAVMLVPACLRPSVAAASAVVVAMAGAVLLSSGWHRASDVVGGFLIAMVWLSAVRRIDDRLRFPDVHSVGGVELPRPLAVAAASVVVLTAFLLVVIRGADGVADSELPVFIVVTGSVQLGAFAVIGRFLSSGRGRVCHLES